MSVGAENENAPKPHDPVAAVMGALIDVPVPEGFGAGLAWDDHEKVLIHKDMELGLRKRRATEFADAVARCHPDDVRQLATAMLIDLSVGMPEGAVFGTIREDSRWWAALANPIELLEVACAALDRLGDRALHLTQRKRLFWLMWQSFPPQQRRAFLAYAKGEGAE